MDHYKYIAVVLVYRNVDDLEECVVSMQEKILSLKIVVVNAFFDDTSMNSIKAVSEKYGCAFLNIENRGYSYGNNMGVEYALNHYSFEYVIISNPDIVVKKFKPPVETQDIVAPKIIARDGNLQNPMIIRRNRCVEMLNYYGLKNNCKPVLFLGLGLAKLERVINIRIVKRDKDSYPIFQPHGSFVIISRRVIESLHPIYDENMFLFAEEGVLALKANSAGFQPYYCSNIEINHKEDGSMKLAGTPINNELKKSNVYFYEKYIKTNNY